MNSVFLVISLLYAVDCAAILPKRLTLAQLRYCSELNMSQLPGNCMELLCHGYNVSGVYDIYPLGKPKYHFKVYCDQTTDDGGWLVFQRRMDGTVNFLRNWFNYKLGFGDLNSEFWLGNDKLYLLTSKFQQQELRIDIESQTNEWRYAIYDNFLVKNETYNYQLSVSNYSGNSGDSLSFHDGMEFTTIDHDNDAEEEMNCAENFKGAWWYNNCHTSNLNGFYYGGNGYHVDDFASGVNWVDWGGYYYSFKTTEMKIRPLLQSSKHLVRKSDKF